MEETNEKSNLDIYKVLKVKFPRKFHLRISQEKISEALKLIEEAKSNLKSTPFPTNKIPNQKIINEICRRLENLSWNIVYLNDAIDRLGTLRQVPRWIFLREYEQLIKYLDDSEPII